MRDPLAKRTVPNLVVTLEKRYERLRGQVSAGLATRHMVAIGRYLSLIGEPLGQAAPEVAHRIVRVVRVVPILLPDGEHVQRMVNVVIPLRPISSIPPIPPISRP